MPPCALARASRRHLQLVGRRGRYHPQSAV